MSSAWSARWLTKCKLPAKLSLQLGGSCVHGVLRGHLTYTNLLKSSTGWAHATAFPSVWPTPEILVLSCSCYLHKTWRIFFFFFFFLSGVWNTEAFHGLWCKCAMHQGNTWAWKWNLYGGRKGEFLFLYEDHRSGCTTHGQESVNLSVNVFPDPCASMADLIDIDWLVHKLLDTETCRQHHRNLVSGGNQGQDTISLENLWDVFKVLGRRWFNDLDTNHIVNVCPTVSFSYWSQQRHQELLRLSARKAERNHYEIAALPSLRSKHSQKLLQVVDPQDSSGSLKRKEM